MTMAFRNSIPRRYSDLSWILLLLCCQRAVFGWNLPPVPSALTGFSKRNRISNLPLCLTTRSPQYSKEVKKRRPLRATLSSADNEKEKPNDNSDTDDSSLRRRLSVGAILVSAFLNLLGFTMAGPITPALGKHFDLAVGASFGSLTSAYPAGMLMGLFLWPQMSDRIGRKPVLTASLMGSGLGLAAQAHAIRAGWPLPYFLATRVLTGSFAGSAPVSKAFLADSAQHPSELPQYLALRDAACTMAFIVGPVLGGILFHARRAGSAVQHTTQSSGLCHWRDGCSILGGGRSSGPARARNINQRK